MSNASGFASIKLYDNTSAKWQIAKRGDGSLYFASDIDTTSGTSLAAATKLIIQETGNVGIGTASPFAKLQVNTGTDQNLYVQPGNYAGGPAGAGISIRSLNDANSAPEPFTVQGSTVLLNPNSNGYVGIGTASPATTLQVVGDIRTGTSGTNGCVQNFAGTALAGTCSSDAALKTVTGNVSQVLDKLTNLNLVNFTWNQTAANVYDDAMNVTNTGFIAQDVQKQFPELVSTDSNGYLRLDYTTLSLYGLEAIKEMNLNLEGIAGTATPISGSDADNFVTAFFKNVENKLVAWFADAGNGIGDLFANKIHTKEICVAKSDGTEYCMNGDQLQSLSSGSGSTPPQTPQIPPPTTDITKTTTPTTTTTTTTDSTTTSGGTDSSVTQ